MADEANTAILRLLREHAWNATAYQIVNPGLDHWFSQDGDAVVAYVLKQRTRVVAGAPVCSRHRLTAVIDEWEQSCLDAGHRSCYFGAAGRLAEILGEDSRYSRVVMGSQPVWSPAEWHNTFARKASLRAQLHRARNHGLVVEEWPVERATAHPALQQVLTDWLSRRGLPPLHFLVEPQTLENLEDKRVFVGCVAGEPVAFVNMAPVPTRAGWLTEQFVRSRRAPNGSIEAVVDFAVRTVAAEGARYVTMGLVPLAGPTDENPAWLKALSTWARAHGRRFYNFAGLEAFKTKFVPDSWEPIYVFSKEPRFSFRSLHAVAAAFTGVPPALALSQGLARAVSTEWGRFRAIIDKLGQ
ncbi:MAG: DUF2156 domain-containing protein [Armatimonadetes bacterium]|nr:DUF2156 domain-containing protein [Armatimonadota bacterium]